MTVKYKTVITKAGAEKLAAATLPNGKKVNFTAMAVGDGGGKLPEPNAGQTKLVNEVWRHTLNKISQDKKNKNYVVAELVIPPEAGGFWMRETGLYDDAGTLIAVGSMAESYKPELAEGSGRAQTVRMVIMVSDIDTVELAIDTTLVMATQDYVDEKLAEHEQSRRHPDATLKEKGFVQLSSAIDSASETLAATPGAVKAAYDLAKGKYTAQDATTAQKGIVQLSSATDSASEALAATPKAVKAANDNANGRVPEARKVNGHALTADINVTSADIFNGQAVGLGGGVDLNTITTPGLYYQPANAQAQAGANYPEPNAGSLEVYKHAGITQVYRIYINSACYVRTYYSSKWSAWARVYDTAFKPSAADVGALSVSGGTLNGNLTVLNTIQVSGRGDARIWVGDNDSGLVNSVDGQVDLYANGRQYGFWNTTQLSYSGEIISQAANGLRVAYGSYGFFIRNDGGNTYFMLTNANDNMGSYNSLRPLTISNSTGQITLGKVNIADWTYLDARYYTKAQSDAGYMPRTGAYTKTESDTRYQAKGSYTPAGEAYTKAQSDSRYVQNVQLGAQSALNGNPQAPNGCVFTYVYLGERVAYKPIQIYINGAWRTIAG